MKAETSGALSPQSRPPARSGIGLGFDYPWLLHAPAARERDHSGSGPALHRAFSPLRNPTACNGEMPAPLRSIPCAELRREATLDLIEALHSPQLAKDLKDVYDGIRSAGLSIDHVRNMPNPAGAAPLTDDRRSTALTGQLSGLPGSPLNQKRGEGAITRIGVIDYESARADLDIAGFLAMKERVWRSSSREVPGPGASDRHEGMLRTDLKRA